MQYEEQQRAESSQEMDIEFPINLQVLSEKAGNIRQELAQSSRLQIRPASTFVVDLEDS